MQETVLLVEDNPTLGEVMLRLLAIAGFRAMLARSGAEARALCAAEPFGVVVLDVRLPDEDGDRTAIALRAAGCDALLIGWTCAPEVLSATRAAAFDRVLPKPIEPAAFLAALRR